jgi:hypothetical protein
LSNLSIDTVDRALARDRPDAVLVMRKAIGVSWPTTKSILRVRARTRGISPGELEECERTFSRLKPAIARQVIGFQLNQSQPSRFGRTAA